MGVSTSFVQRRPEGSQQISPGQSEAVSADERRPGIGESRLRQP
jgi:hypothetical protein